MNNTPLRNIRLYGVLGSKFGRVHRAHLDTNTPAEAMRYLRSQFPGIDAYLMGAKDKGIGFAVFRGKENIGADQLGEPVGNDDIRIAPIIMGSKNGGVFQIILGVALILVGVFAEGISAGTSTQLIISGASMVAGGVVQLLTQAPRGAKGRDSPENAPSYVFNGAVNTQAQGNPAGLLYGKHLTGSAVVSAGINAEDYSPVTTGVGGGHVLPPGFRFKTPYDEVPA